MPDWLKTALVTVAIALGGAAVYGLIWKGTVDARLNHIEQRQDRAEERGKYYHGDPPEQLRGSK